MSEHMPEKKYVRIVSQGDHWNKVIFLCFSGWWFGSWLLFFHILRIIIPTDFHICQRGRSTTNQLCFYMSLKWRFTMGCFIPWSGVYLRVFFSRGIYFKALGVALWQWVTFGPSDLMDLFFYPAFDCTTGKLQYQVYQVMIFHRWNIWKQRFDMSHVEIPQAALVALVVVFAGEAGLAMEQTWSGFLWAPLVYPGWGFVGCAADGARDFRGRKKQNHGISLTVILKWNMEKCEVNASAFTRSKHLNLWFRSYENNLQ